MTGPSKLRYVCQPVHVCCPSPVHSLISHASMMRTLRSMAVPGLVVVPYPLAMSRFG